MSQQPAASVTPDSRDALTGALTRPSLIALLNEQAAHAQRTRQRFLPLPPRRGSPAHINDSRGIAAGDAVLAGLAARLRSVLEQPAWHRSEYTLARYDGGALMVLARPCACIRARPSPRRCASASRKRRSRSAERERLDRRRATPYRRVDDSLLARIERIVYLAKQFGRDRVEVSPTPPSRVERAKVVGIRD